MALFKRKAQSSSRSRRSRTVTRPAADVDLPTYRRNRTMTDRSTLPEVSERARIHHLRAVRRKIGIVLLLVTVCAALTLFGVSQFSGTVRTVSHDTSLTQTIDEATYQTIFTSYYQRHPLERFRFLMDYDRLTAFLRQQAPEIKTISPAGTGGLGVSRYELTMRRPVASWAVDTMRYYVDAEGVTFEKSYYKTPKVSVVDNSGAQINKGSAIASSRLLSFVGRVIALSEAKGITIAKIEIPSESMRQIHVTGRGMPQVRMTVDRAVETQVNDMAAALKYLHSAKRAVKYVDVRVEGKAFYQ